MQNGELVRVGAVADHAHLLIVLSKNHALCRVVQEVNKASSKWLKRAGGPPDFHWQNGYAAFSVSQSNVEAVRDYIRRQPEHHAKQSFQDELREWLRRYEIAWDEGYVWD